MKKSLLLTTLLIACAILISKAQRSWDFTNWSQATLDNLAADPTNWENASETRFANAVVFAAETPIMANGVEIAELQGLTFGELNANKLRIDHGLETPPDRFILNGSSLSINIPDCKAGDVVRVLTHTANTDYARGITATNATRTAGEETSLETVENVFAVDADGTVTFTTTGGLHFRMLTVNMELPSGANSISSADLQIVRTSFYNLNGQFAASDFKSLPRGIYIQKNFFENGTSEALKIAKVK